MKLLRNSPACCQGWAKLDFIFFSRRPALTRRLNQSARQNMTDSLMSTYKRLPVTFERGEGAWLWDTEGKRYLDAVSGIAVCNLGHAHPAVTEALCQQAGQLVHTSNLYQVARQRELGETLTRLTGMDRVFFCNSGAEANEAAIKIARLYGHGRGIKQPTIVVAEGSFHGRTLATLTATGNRKVQAGFEPLVQGFLRVPYDDLDAVYNVAKNSSEVVAVLVEPIQGEGGVRVPQVGYLSALRKLCDEHGWLLMLDEIQAGLCRTGTWLASHHEGIHADVVTLAKALGNGVPIGACLARGKAADVFQPGNHGSTFGGNPLACSAGLAVLQTMHREHAGERAMRMGERIVSGLKHALEGVSGVRHIRGQGLMMGVELDRPCTDLVPMALAQGLLINVTADSVIRLLPPLIISEAEADQIVAGVTAVVREFYARAAA